MTIKLLRIVAIVYLDPRRRLDDVGRSPTSRPRRPCHARTPRGRDCSHAGRHRVAIRLRTTVRVWWEEPTPSSPGRTTAPGLPARADARADGRSGFWLPLDATRKVAALFPDSISVTIPEAGHESSFWSQCSAGLGLPVHRDTGRWRCRVRECTGGCLSGGGSVSPVRVPGPRCGGGPERKQPDRFSGAKSSNGRLGGRDRRFTAQLFFRRWSVATRRNVSHRLRRLMDGNIERLRLFPRCRREWDCYLGI